MRPFGELDLGHQLRRDPVHFSQGIRSAGERTAVRLQLLQCLRDLLERHLVEASAGLAYMNEVSVLVVEAKHDRTEIGPAALWISVAADDAVQRLRYLDLKPLATAALLIATAPALGQNSFQPFFPCCIE